MQLISTKPAAVNSLQNRVAGIETNYFTMPDHLDVPDWSIWQDRLVGFSAEPIVMVVSRKDFVGKHVPETRRELITFIRNEPNFFREKVITNLIDNALKYGRKADVFIQASSQAVQIHIRDYGDAITPEYLGNLTRPFDRGTNAENIDGYGIGLAIASTIAAQHGGNISFENWAQGICAVLTLPR